MTKQQTILVVDDEATVREVVRRYLELDNFKVIDADNGPLALHLLHQEKPDLLVLDIMLPGLDGLTLTRTLRQPAVDDYDNTQQRIPIIMLTARTQEADRITGFELGADDYVSKPFSPRELVMRIKAVLRRTTKAEPIEPQQPLIFGDLQLDASSRTVKSGDRVITLTAMEFDLLWFFAQHPNHVFNRDQLLNQVWGYDYYGDDSTVTVHIRRLREKIEADPSQPVYIQTVWGVGYKFEPPA